MPHLVHSLKLIARLASRAKRVGRKKKTTNYKLSTTHFNVKQGFTLVEFLVVLGILSISIGSSLLFLTSVLKGSNQASATSEVKQNGQVVLDSLERQIRNAVDASKVGNVIRLKLADSTYLFVSCFNAVPSVSNGWIGVAKNTNGALPSSSDYQSVTNNSDPISGINIETCELGVVDSTSGTLSPDIVNIAFTASQGIAAPSRRDFQAQAPFKTTISLRRY